MLQVAGIIVSSFFLSISQPLIHSNGRESLSAASASGHCACACCKGRVCHCGKEKTSQASGPSASTKSSSKTVPLCCGKTKHLPEQGNTPGLIGMAPSFNELQKNLTSGGDETIQKLSLSINKIHSLLIAFSPGIHSPSFFPLRI